MKAQLLIAACVVGGLFLLVTPANALAPPHDATNTITCVNCHAPHPGGSALLVRDAAQDVLCKTCHNPTGQASSMALVALHTVNTGATIVDCGSCHDPHGAQDSTDPHTSITAPNLSLIRDDTAKYVAGALEPAIFQVRPDNFAFGNGDTPYNGVCQTCHQATTYHRNDGSVDNSHNLGTNCIQCHAHENGFLPSACTDCHNQPQDNGDGVPLGGRRAVVGEFPTDPAHGHYGSVSVDDNDCLVCHQLTAHQSGVVVLVDPDDGNTTYSFEQPTDLTGDPDVSNFCANCHDADGATRLTTPADPFGNGFAPPDVASKFQGTLQWLEWYGDQCFGAEGTLRGVNSHHDISDADQAFSGAKIECMDCHGSHNPSDQAMLADPDDVTTSWTGTINEFCTRCHFGGDDPADPAMPPELIPPTVDQAGTDVSTLRPMESCDYNNSPWFVNYTWSHAPHGGDSKRGWPGYSGAPAAELDCTACHDPHGSWTPTNTAGNPYMIVDSVDGTAMVDDGIRDGGAWTGPPWNTMGASRPVVVSVTPGANPPPGGTDYAIVDWGSNLGLCKACHATWENSYTFMHGFCGACQTCHGHGQDWANTDWGPMPDDSTPCHLCGNDAIDGIEECDDGNTADGDGCSSECTNE